MIGNADYFSGRTISHVDASACNLWQFYFTDGGDVVVSVERVAGDLHGMVVHPGLEGDRTKNEYPKGNPYNMSEEEFRELVDTLIHLPQPPEKDEDQVVYLLTRETSDRETDVLAVFKSRDAAVRFMKNHVGNLLAQDKIRGAYFVGNSSDPEPVMETDGPCEIYAVKAFPVQE